MTLDTRRRKYQSTGVERAPGGWCVLLDGKPMRTPAAQNLIAPRRALAEAIAAEWAAQEDRIDPLSMPVTRAACTALDRVAPNRALLVRELCGYGATDLLLHRAEAPSELAEIEADLWDDFLDWAHERYGARLFPTVGILAEDQPPEVLAALNAAVEGLDAWRLTALAELVSLSGSLVIGLAVEEGARDPAHGWRASRVDEDWQVAQWGEDAEAAAAASRRKQAFFEAADLARMLRGQG